MQCVGVKSELPEEVFETLKHLTQETLLSLRGEFARSSAPRADTRLDINIGRSAPARF